MGTKLYAVWDTEKGEWWNHKTYLLADDAKWEWWFGVGKGEFLEAERHYKTFIGRPGPRPVRPDPFDFLFPSQTRFVIREVTLQPVEDLA